jgi:succinate dehydrogenase/fumarate reductase flavoprotein subunit
MKSVMNDHVSVFRTGEGMQEALEKVRELKERFKHVRWATGARFSTPICSTPGSWATCSTWQR